MRIDPDLPCIKGDEMKLRQVLTNLLGNAIKFTLPGGAIVVAASPSPAGGVRVAIRDTGIGMSEEEVAQALRPFGQVDGGRSRWREGAGLGLPIAKALIGLHGGTLEIKSVKGTGTEVTVSLPSPEQVSAVARNQTA